MTQAAFAKSLELSRASVANIERGTQAVQLHVIFKIAAVLNVEVQELIPAIDLGITNVGVTIQVKDWLKRIDADAVPVTSTSNAR